VCRILGGDAIPTARDGLVLSGRRRIPPGLLALALAAAAVAHALWSGWVEGWTYDEAFHLQWSERFLDAGITERASEERFNSKTPIMVPSVLVRKAARAAGVSDARALRFAARVPCALWLALLLATVYVATRRWISPAAAALATAAAALDPNLVAHASLATTDVAFALAALATLVTALALWVRPSLRASLLFGVALGLAFVAKVSAVLLVPGVAVVPLLARREDGARGWRPAFTWVAMGLLVAWVVVSGAYLFRGMGRPLAELGFRSSLFQRVERALPGLTLPVPEAFLTALDASLGSERRDWNIVILGRRYPTGVWYYFAFLWLVKTPLLLLAAEVVGLVRAARDAAVRHNPLVRLLAWNVALTLTYFSLFFHAQIGYRYVLMAVPMAYIVAAAGLATLPWRRPWTVLAAVVVLVSAAEDVAYLGDPLAFTSLAVQPKRLALRLVADSNIDWGQNREDVADLMAERGWTRAAVNPVHIMPGRNVIDLNLVAGVGDFEQYRWVRENLSPRGHLAHTWLWYDVDDETFNRFLYEARRRFPGPLDAETCPPSLDYALVQNGGETAFSVLKNPDRGEVWVTCVIARRETDVGLRVGQGGVGVGTFTAPGQCRATTLVQGDEAWWRLEPGTHAFCLVVQPNRRAWLPYRLEASWAVTGWSARFNVRPPRPAPTPPPPEATSPRSSSPPRPPTG
jgi:4-amino-4-deoxy-L-arabinose transferase-like glycosyltransferase